MPRGNWIITRSGRKVFPLDFRIEMFDIKDVAHALSNICRFVGHTPRFYSVAEHCCLVSDEVWRRTQDYEQTLQGLLHDASEAYLGDLSNPLKSSEEFGFYKSVERGIEQVIFEHHQIPRHITSIVKQVDAGMLLKEGYQFFPDSVVDWTYPTKDTPIPAGEIKCLSPAKAYSYFMELHNEIMLRLQESRNGL